MSLNTELFSFLNLNRLAGKSFLVAKRIVLTFVLSFKVKCVSASLMILNRLVA